MIQTPILITGSSGQLGQVLYTALVEKFGSSKVIATDIKDIERFEHGELLDILDMERMEQIISTYQIKTVFHLAALLSAVGESKPVMAWKINTQGFINVLEASKNTMVEKVFFPSSIAVFGKEITLKNTPQHSPLHPTTVYGIAKAACENWCQYYYDKCGLDVRSLRYPGIVGYQSLPGGGTTDYAVDIFHEAIQKRKYNCFLKPQTYLPMIYMEDAIRATIELMEAPPENVKIRTSYNLQGMSFSPAELAAEIQNILPNFQIEYTPDFRQKIAKSWPQSIDDTNALMDWGWQPRHNLKSMTEDMIENLTKIYSNKNPLNV